MVFDDNGAAASRPMDIDGDGDEQRQRPDAEKQHRVSPAITRPSSARSRPGRKLKTVYLIRHGVALHNSPDADLANDLSLLDAPLTARGVRQAEATADKLRRYLATSDDEIVVISSPLTRCLQTASILARRCLGGGGGGGDSSGVIVCHEDVREACGIHQPDRRRGRSDLVAKWPTVRFDPSVTEEDEGWRPDRRETVEDVCRRVRSFLRWLSSPSSDVTQGTAIVASHGVWIECCLQAYCPAALSGGRRVHNCDLYRADLVVDDGWATMDGARAGDADGFGGGGGGASGGGAVKGAPGEGSDRAPSAAVPRGPRLENARLVTSGLLC